MTQSAEAQLRVLLIRHGQTDSNAGGILQGHLPVPLNDLGRQQAALVARRLARLDPPVDALVSSDLERAVQTAEPIERALGLRPRLDRRWRERSFGPLEGVMVGDAELWRAAAGTLNPEGAEPIDAMADRVLDAYGDLLARHRPGETVAVVTHGGVVRTTLALLGAGRLPLSQHHRPVEVEPILNASILHLSATMSQSGPRWRVGRVNDIDHLG
jgi:broad specificity phosphatase PhoE